ncbi:MAG: N-acetylglutaminylglutamine synthetase, partial [Pararhodobacter sp.]|nr:N-acetylglutaminylglutamine synthetase [Pararhodobacter sp.]
MAETEGPRRRAAQAHRLKRLPSAAAQAPRGATTDALVDCGWGRLIFAHTFQSDERLAEAL